MNYETCPSECAAKNHPGKEHGEGVKHEPAGIIHPAQVFLPRATYDQLGEDAVRKLAGPDAEVTIFEPDDDKNPYRS